MSCSHRSACAEVSLVVSSRLGRLERPLWSLLDSEHLLAGRKASAAGLFLPHQACFEQFPSCWNSPPKQGVADPHCRPDQALSDNPSPLSPWSHVQAFLTPAVEKGTPGQDEGQKVMGVCLYRGEGDGSPPATATNAQF